MSATAKESKPFPMNENWVDVKEPLKVSDNWCTVYAEQIRDMFDSSWTYNPDQMVTAVCCNGNDTCCCMMCPCALKKYGAGLNINRLAIWLRIRKDPSWKTKNSGALEAMWKDQSQRELSYPYKMDCKICGTYERQCACARSKFIEYMDPKSFAECCPL